jgi:hypothetical protein
VLAVEQLPPVQLDALVVVTERFQGPAWAAPERTATATIATTAKRKRISTSVRENIDPSIRTH